MNAVEKAYGMTVAMTTMVKMRIKTVGMISLISSQVTDLSSLLITAWVV